MGITETDPAPGTSRCQELVRRHGRLPLPERAGEDDEGEVTTTGHRASLCTLPFACLESLTHPPVAGDERQGLAPGPAPGLSELLRQNGFPRSPRVLSLWPSGSRRALRVFSHLAHDHSTPVTCKGISPKPLFLWGHGFTPSSRICRKCHRSFILLNKTQQSHVILSPAYNLDQGISLPAPPKVCLSCAPSYSGRSETLARCHRDDGAWGWEHSGSLGHL